MFTLSFLAASKLGARMPWGSSSVAAGETTAVVVSRQGKGSTTVPMGNGGSDGQTLAMSMIEGVL